MMGAVAGWTAVPVSEVQPGDRVRVSGGQEVLVSRIEPRFMGIDTMVAFIEDTPTRWFKMPVPQSGEVEVQRS